MLSGMSVRYPHRARKKPVPAWLGNTNQGPSSAMVGVGGGMVGVDVGFLVTCAVKVAWAWAEAVSVCARS